MSKRNSFSSVEQSIKEKFPGCEYYVDENNSLHDVVHKMSAFGLFSTEILSKKEKKFLLSPRGKEKPPYINKYEYFLLHNEAKIYTASGSPATKSNKKTFCLLQ